MPRIPTSSYRVQLHAGFTFADACGILPYLKDLGISHVYCSPYMQAAKGSMHGYDVIDQQKVNSELGGEEGQTRFLNTLKELELGQLLDIVPNHMATGAGNRYWWDVLENGPSSRFADWFDIDWNSAEVKLQNKVLIPVLGDQYGHVLNKHEIVLQYDGEAFTVHYFDHVFPLAPRSLAVPLSTAARYINVPILSFVADSLARLPSPDSTDEDVQTARHRDKTILYDLLQRACKEEPDVLAAIMRAVEEINRNVDALDTLLNLQSYRLAYWRTADQELGYRRFFDINTLIGLRVERARVFNATHFRVLHWLRNGDLDGVRVDHPDGLRDPEQYFEWLRSNAPQAWILAEKILQPNESLRPNWPIAGTTGYDFFFAVDFQVGAPAAGLGKGRAGLIGPAAANAGSATGYTAASTFNTCIIATGQCPQLRPDDTGPGGRDPIIGPSGIIQLPPGVDEDNVDTSFATEPLIDEPVTSGGESTLWSPPCDPRHDPEHRCQGTQP